MNKKKGCLLTIIFPIFVVLIIIPWLIDRNEIIITNLVNDNIEFLNESINENNYDKIYQIKQVKQIRKYSFDEKEIFIDFFCTGVGIAPSGAYYGFYYTSLDKPRGFQSGNETLEKNEKYWEWEEVNGDNYYKTKRIKAHWYYYEAGF